MTFAYPCLIRLRYTLIFTLEVAMMSVETTRTNIGTAANHNYVYLLDDVDAGYTRGVFGYSYANAPDYERWYVLR